MNSYLDIAIERKSDASFDRENPFSASLVSAESHHAKGPHRLLAALQNRNLTASQRAMLIEYFLLRKTQAQIARLHGRKSQGIVSEEIKAILANRSKLPVSSPQMREKNRNNRRTRTLRFAEPKDLGAFEVRIPSARIFTSRAGQVSNASDSLL